MYSIIIYIIADCNYDLLDVQTCGGLRRMRMLAIPLVTSFWEVASSVWPARPIAFSTLKMGRPELESSPVDSPSTSTCWAPFMAAASVTTILGDRPYHCSQSFLPKKKKDESDEGEMFPSQHKSGSIDAWWCMYVHFLEAYLYSILVWCSPGSDRVWPTNQNSRVWGWRFLWIFRWFSWNNFWSACSFKTSTKKTELNATQS